MGTERLDSRKFLDCEKETILMLLNQCVFTSVTCMSYLHHTPGRGRRCVPLPESGGPDLAELSSHRRRGAQPCWQVTPKVEDRGRGRNVPHRGLQAGPCEVQDVGAPRRRENRVHEPRVHVRRQPGAGARQTRGRRVWRVGSGLDDRFSVTRSPVCQSGPPSQCLRFLKETPLPSWAWR